MKKSNLPTKSYMCISDNPKMHSSNMVKVGKGYADGGIVKNARESDEDSQNDWGAKNSRERNLMEGVQNMPQETAWQLAKKGAAAIGSEVARPVAATMDYFDRRKRDETASDLNNRLRTKVIIERSGEDTTKA